MTDLPVYLPGGVYLESLVITPDFNVLSDVMQRAIILLICGNYEDLWVDGMPIMTYLRQTTTAGARELGPALSGVADALKDKLNDRDTNDDPSSVSAVYFDVIVKEDATADVNLVIEMSDTDVESTVVYRYE